MSENPGTRMARFQGLLPTDWGLLLAAFTAAYGVGLLSLIALPFIVGATMSTLGINESQAGLLGTMEFLGVMCTSLAIAPIVGQANRRIMALSGALIVVVANGLCLFFDSYHQLIWLRPVAGLGAGLALATGNATVANAEQPERFAGHMTTLFVALMVCVMFGFAKLSEIWGQAGVYGGLAFTVMALSPLLGNLPVKPAQSFLQAHRLDRPTSRLLSQGGLLMLAIFFVFSLRDTMSWAFAESIGASAGFSSEEVGRLLGIQSIFGLSGPLVASIVGSRFGVRPPLVVGLIASGLVTYLISQSSNSKLLYESAVMFWTGTYFFSLAYLTALAAELDVEGRIVAASGCALMAGLAAGPFIAGQLITQGGYGLIGIINVILVLLTLVFVLLTGYKLPKLKAVLDQM